MFLQSGEQDLNAIWGNWALANQAMASALNYARYDYQFVFGEGTHSLRHGGQLFPKTLKWDLAGLSKGEVMLLTS